MPLFERSGRGIYLNDFGKKFYARAETILRERTDVERELKEMRDQFTGRIAIATSAARQINQLMIHYMEEHPSALFRLNQMLCSILIRHQHPTDAFSIVQYNFFGRGPSQDNTAQAFKLSS